MASSFALRECCALNGAVGVTSRCEPDSGLVVVEVVIGTWGTWVLSMVGVVLPPLLPSPGSARVRVFVGDFSILRRVGITTPMKTCFRDDPCLGAAGGLCSGRGSCEECMVAVLGTDCCESCERT